jgi:predicted PurR-regulated permease PerM
MFKTNSPKVFLFVLLGVVLLLGALFWPYLSSIVLAFIIASPFYPFYKKLKSRLKDRQTLAALIMVILIFFILVIPIGWLIATISNQAYDFYMQTKDDVTLQKIDDLLKGESLWVQNLNKFAQMVNLKIDAQTIKNFFAFAGKNIGLFLAKQLNAIASNLINFLIQFFLMLLMIYYIFRDGVHLKKYILELLPFPDTHQELIIEKFRETGKALIFGNALSGVVQGILGGFGFFIFGLGSPFLWGTVITVFAFLPLIGSCAVYLPAAFILFIQGPTWKAVCYLIYNILYSTLMEYVIKPHLIGKQMQINPVLLFITILGGLKLFGILGIIYGPLLITIFFTLVAIYKKEYKAEI